MFEAHVFARSTAHSAVLYWDKPAAAGAGAQYTVYLGGQPVATCGRTHFTLTDLRSQSDYQADVFTAISAWAAAYSAPHRSRTASM